MTFVPGVNVRGHAQETEAYCNEIIEAERQNLHLKTLIVTATREGARLDMTGPQCVENVLWRRLNSPWRQAGADLRAETSKQIFGGKSGCGAYGRSPALVLYRCGRVLPSEKILIERIARKPNSQ